MTHPDEASQSGHEPTLDHLVDCIDRAARESNKVLVRWLLAGDMPLLAACALFTLHPQPVPMGIDDVADAIGISAEDAAAALRELRSLGYAHEDDRRYEPTERGERLLASLASARREAIDRFVASLTEQERRELGAALSEP